MRFAGKARPSSGDHQQWAIRVSRTHRTSLFCEAHGHHTAPLWAVAVNARGQAELPIFEHKDGNLRQFTVRGEGSAGSQLRRGTAHIAS